MALTTAGKALAFAKELEQTLQTVYSLAAALAASDGVKAVMTDLAAGSDRRQLNLQRLYDDHVYSDMDTGVLAPIASIDPEAYALEPIADKFLNDTQILAAARENEMRLRTFYADLTQRLQSGPRTMTRRIDKFGREIDQRLQQLEGAAHG